MMKKTSKRLVLLVEWEKRCQLMAEGNKLWAESNKLMAEGSKLWAEGDKLMAEGDILWLDAVISVHGNIKLEWKNWNCTTQSYECHLETGEVFK